MWNDTLFYDWYYIACLPLFYSFKFGNGKCLMRNVIINFNYSIQNHKKLDANHKLIFREFEREIKGCTKLSADIQFLYTYYYI